MRGSHAATNGDGCGGQAWGGGNCRLLMQRSRLKIEGPRLTTPVLDITAVVKDYRGLRPLRLGELTLGSGDQVAILGMDEPSAEMLTTLITGAAVPDAGIIRVLGMGTADITTTDEWLALVDRIGLVTHRAALLEMLSTIQNLAMSFTLEIEPPSQDIRDRAAALAAEVGLPESLWDRPVGDLDDAAKTRVRLGRALAFNPVMLLLEHPTAQVERPAIQALAHDIRDLAARRALATLTISGDHEFAEAVGARLMDWEAATGRLCERRRGWWPWR